MEQRFDLAVVAFEKGHRVAAAGVGAFRSSIWVAGAISTSGPAGAKNALLRSARMTRRPLKVFRTSAGFDDAYIATTSRRAALEAWGTDKDLFARGAAEQITDPELMAPALERPGEVVRLPRASAAQHLSAAEPAGNGPSRKKRTPAGTPSKPRKRPPRPSRAALDAARAALDRQEREAAEALNGIDRKIEALRERRASLRQAGLEAAEGLRADVAREEEAYRKALDAWEERSG